MLHEIRKYPNRRFYDATERRHVTLEEVRDLILAGDEVRVTDSKTDEDITAAVLTQLILKLDVSKLQLFPSALLHRVIRANGGLVQEFVEKYLHEALGFFIEAQRRVEGQVRRSFGLPPAAAGGDDGEAGSIWGGLPMGPLAPPWWAWPGVSRGAGSSSAPPPASQEAEEGSSAEEVRQMRAEVAELKALVEQLQRGSREEADER